MRRRTRESPPDVQKSRILSPGCATRTGERFWMPCKEFYRGSSLQFVAILLTECNAHAFSAASPTRFSERRTVRSQLRVARAEERGGTFSLAGSARTLRRDGCLLRASPSQTPPRERSARCNANRFEELACVLTPSNMEGGPERPAFCDNQTAAESPFQFAFAQSVGRLFRKSPVALANEVLSRLTSA